MSTKELSPGESFILDFPVYAQDPAKQIGVAFYAGNIPEGHRMVYNLMWAYGGPPKLGTGWKAEMEYYLEKVKAYVIVPKRREVWCDTLVSFQSESTNNPSRP